MSDPLVQPMVAEPVPGLSQVQRVSNVFTAPSKTFEDIKRGNKSWWMPFVIFTLIGYVLFAAVTLKIGMQQVVENQIHLNPKQEQNLNEHPEQREMTMKVLPVLAGLTLEQLGVLGGFEVIDPGADDILVPFTPLPFSAGDPARGVSPKHSDRVEDLAHCTPVHPG